MEDVAIELLTYSAGVKGISGESHKSKYKKNPGQKVGPCD
jgi:hypothetical protein